MCVLVVAVQWCPDRASVFGSCAEDGLLNVWDYEKVKACPYPTCGADCFSNWDMLGKCNYYRGDNTLLKNPQSLNPT
jgi:hypothetical protein